MADPIYSVTLHHLSPDAKAAGLSYPDVQLPTVTIAQLRELLYALRDLAGRLTIYEPSQPEIRIKTEREVLIVRTRYRQLHLVGWESALRGQEHSVSFILTTITGTAEPVRPLGKVERVLSMSPFGRPASVAPVHQGFVPRWLKITLLLALIVGCNATAAWLLMRPPPNLAPKYVLLPETESGALLTKVAGEYVTGNTEGDRRLVVMSDGRLLVSKFGPAHAIVEETTRSARGALVDGRPALITSDPYMMTIKDSNTVILYGNTYHRRAP